MSRGEITGLREKYDKEAHTHILVVTVGKPRQRDDGSYGIRGDAVLIKHAHEDHEPGHHHFYETPQCRKAGQPPPWALGPQYEAQEVGIPVGQYEE